MAWDLDAIERMSLASGKIVARAMMGRFQQRHPSRPRTCRARRDCAGLIAERCGLQ